MPDFEPDNDKEYKVEAIRDNIVFIKETDGYQPRLYYLVVWKGYLEEENTWKPFLAVIHLWKIVNIFYKNYPEKPKASSTPIDSALPMAKPTI